MELAIGIDAAWTERNPSGVAVLGRKRGGDWHALAVAPSYVAFRALARGTPPSWTERPAGGHCDVSALVEAASAIGAGRVRIVAVDMPLSNRRIDGRRAAETEISRAFGARGCGAHSPTRTRPGKLGADLMTGLDRAGFPLATDRDRVAAGPCSIEVYPHPAMLTLLSEDYRVPYKVSRSQAYWPGTSVGMRVEQLWAELRRIYEALDARVGPLPFGLPASNEGFATLASLKRFEDALDALVCAWVAAKVVDGEGVPYGDDEGSIWVPE